MGYIIISIGFFAYTWERLHQQVASTYVFIQVIFFNTNDQFGQIEVSNLLDVLGQLDAMLTRHHSLHKVWISDDNSNTISTRHNNSNRMSTGNDILDRMSICLDRLHRVLPVTVVYMPR